MGLKNRQMLKRAGKRTRIVGIVFLVAVCLALLGYYLPGYFNKERAVTQPASPADMVNLRDFIPGIQIELAYATENNICHQPIYDSNEALLRRGTAEKLKKAQEALQSQGYSLKVWDAYRPPQAQYKLWQVMPDSRYVINPHKGFSNHSRGIAVDVTLVDSSGAEILMPTGFDNFTAKADRDYSDISAQQANNARILEKAMVESGFVSIFYEWWHFHDADKEQYGVYWPPGTNNGVSP